jgi:repressor LexA
MLTKKQLKLYKYLKNYFKENEVMPSFEEMKDYMNVKSKSSVFNMLGYMEWKGYIKRCPAHARAIQILKEVA